jgi:acetyl esterase/lipase
MYSVAAGTLVGTGACQVTVTLTRIAEAAYPASLADGGNATAIVKRRLVINSI